MSKTVEHINPASLFPSLPFAFSQVVASRGKRHVHVAGQTAWDASMQIVGPGDLALQARRAFENVRLALAAAGALPADVVRMRIYVVDYQRENVAAITHAVKEFFGAATPAASTLLGVQALAVPDFLIEVEVDAVTD